MNSSSTDQITKPAEVLTGLITTCRAKVLEYVSENEMNRDPRCITRYEIEEQSPSRTDGINLAKENELRKSYCVFIRDLGTKLKMPLVVVATSTVFCHKFYLYQSHQKNDRYTIATACMFLAGKVEETRRALEEVVHVSYCLQNKNKPTAAQDFKEKGVCERQKELVLLAEQVVLVTLDFNLEVLHPYSFIYSATSKFKTGEILSRVSYIILNDILFTTLCLQFKPEHIAATALLVAAKLLKFKFPHNGWWREFQVTLQQLEEIYGQIVELYEQERGQFVDKLIAGVPPCDFKEAPNGSLSGNKPKLGMKEFLKVIPQSKSLAPSKRKKTEDDAFTDNSQQNRYSKGK